MLRFYDKPTRWKGTHMGNFNTSHVTVLYKQDILYVYYGLEFQYISCYGSIYRPVVLRRFTKISIHLMLRFYKMRGNYLQTCCLNFNTSHVTVLCRLQGLQATYTKFQYISCYGSMALYLSICLL